MVRHGLTINGTVYIPTIPSPPTLHTVKVNFRRIPQHYKPVDIVKLFSSYGKPMLIGMYYRDHPKRKIWTQEGYVLFETSNDLSHPDFPREVKVGPGAPVLLNTVGEPSPPRPTTHNNNNNNNNNNSINNNKDANKAHPAWTVQQKDAEGFQPARRKKRNGRKRIKTSKPTGTHMEGVEPTLPAEHAAQAAPAAQEAAQVANPPPGRVTRFVGYVTGGLFQGSTAGNYRQARMTEDSSDSDGDHAPHRTNRSTPHATTTTPHLVERPQRQRKEVDYNLARSSRLSMQRSDQ
jgi:hypothetical protein